MLFTSFEQVTFVRWIVEQVNGKMKNKFSIFDSRVSAKYLPKLHKYWRIAAALMNAFGNVVLRDEAKHEEIAQRILHQLPQSNELQVRLFFILNIL